MKKRYADGLIPGNNSKARQDVALQMKAARLDRSMTQQELAEITGTKKSNISRMESGNYNPSLDFMVKVAGGMGKQLSIKLE
ncbi:MAG: helix-turn-helix transcriptional regulator [Lachnospiraceae bacterium]|nr:helix-turn-helix transcriptional regulator [Lachnospiraceae bacterium]